MVRVKIYLESERNMQEHAGFIRESGSGRVNEEFHASLFLGTGKQEGGRGRRARNSSKRVGD